MALPEQVTKVALDAASKLTNDIYADVARPAAQEVGKALGTLFKVGLSPVAILDWGFEQSKTWLATQITARLASIPADQQRTPPSHVAVPLLLAVAATSDAQELRGLYAELLLKAMDARTQAQVHPSYASVLGQLTPQEALIFFSLNQLKADPLFSDEPSNHYRRHVQKKESIEDQFHAHCLEIGLADPASDLWLENLRRMRLLDMTTYTEAELVEPERYEEGRAHVSNKEVRHMTITPFGQAFIEACSPPADGVTSVPVA